MFVIILDYPVHRSVWKLNLGREYHLNPYLEAHIHPQTVFVPELGRLVPNFHCSVEIHDPLLVARKDFVDFLSRNFTLRIGETILTATNWRPEHQITPPVQPKNIKLNSKDIKRLGKKFSIRPTKMTHMRGQRFQPILNNTFTNVEIRDPPDFMIFFDDLFQAQQRFVLVTHGYPEDTSVRDPRVLEKIKFDLAYDLNDWERSSVPQYVLYKSRVRPAYLTFMDAMSMINNLNSRRANLKPQEMRMLCSQVEIQTDIYYSGKHDMHLLSVIEQEIWKASFRTIENIRDAIKTNFLIPSFDERNVSREDEPMRQQQQQQSEQDNDPSAEIDSRREPVSTISAQVNSANPHNDSHETPINNTTSSVPNAQIEQPVSISLTSSSIMSTNISGMTNLSTPPVTTFPQVQNRISDSYCRPVTSTLLPHEFMPSDNGLRNSFAIPTFTGNDDIFASTNQSHSQYETPMSMHSNVSNSNIRSRNIQPPNQQSFNNYYTAQENLSNVRFSQPYMHQSNYHRATNSEIQEEINNIPPNFFNNTSSLNNPQSMRGNHNLRQNERNYTNYASPTNYPLNNNPSQSNTNGTGNRNYQPRENAGPYQFQQPHNNNNNAFDLTQLMARLLETQNNSNQNFAPQNASFLPKMNHWNPKFSGNDNCSLTHVLGQWEILAANCHMSHETLLTQVHLLLKDDALLWHNSIGSDIHDWQMYKTAIINRFQSPDRVIATFMSAVNVQKEEKFDDYYARLRMLMKQSRDGISEKQLVMRLITGLKDTRCRDVVRNNYTAATGADWNKIIENINQIETEYDLIEKEKSNSKGNTNVVSPHWTKKVYPPSSSWFNPQKLFNKPLSRNFNNEKSEESKTQEKRNEASKTVKPFNFRSLKTPANNTTFKNSTANSNAKSKDYHGKVKALFAVDRNDEQENDIFVEPTNEIWNEIENNQLLLLNAFESQNFDENDVARLMATQCCTNCDNEGHILENCPLLFEQNQFKLQCVSCRALNVTKETCENCSKN